MKQRITSDVGKTCLIKSKYGTEYLLFMAVVLLSSLLLVRPARAQQEVTDSNTPLHLLQPDYPVPYGITKVEDVTSVLDRIRAYLEAATPAGIVHAGSGEAIEAYSNPGPDAEFAKGDFRLISYEWGVTYAAMLLAGEVTGNSKYTDYTKRRLALLAGLFPHYREQYAKNPEQGMLMESVVNPNALDDAGAMCAAMIKAVRRGVNENLRPMIDNYIDYISNGQFRLSDGTLARNRPQPATLWLDDLFMSVPALAQAGELTGEEKYFNDAVKQVLQFAERMFREEKGLFIHGWVQAMNVHPEFYWARANGWAMMAMVELLDVLPEDHPGRDQVLSLLRAHIKGIAARQSGSGLWHQLLNRTDSYLETSASAIFTYSIARAINEGWVDAKVYGPMTLLAWNAVTTKVNEKGQVEGTCVGTGMGFDPAFYYHRPVTAYAAHGYGPTILAGAEVIRLIKSNRIEINDSTVQFYD